MARAYPTTLQNIFAAKTRKIDYTVDLSFPDATSYPFATSPLSIAEGTYTNDVESVNEIRQTLESADDKVRVALQNKDKVLGIDIAQNWQKWRKAEAVIGRYYQSGAEVKWVEMFRGAVQQPDATDLQVTFDVLTDTVSQGNIIANRTLASPCSAKSFKDPKTCGYVGAETTCNRLLKSAGGCDGRNWAHRFLGMEHRYQIEVSVPGTGGNTGGGGDGPTYLPPCPRIDQYVLIRGEGNQPKPKMVGFLTEADELFNPITGTFHHCSVELVENEPIFELIAANGAISFSSFSHKIIRNLADDTGEPVENFIAGSEVLTFRDSANIMSKAVWAKPTGEKSAVIRIKMADGHIYCAGNSREKFVVCHNRKIEV